MAMTGHIYHLIHHGLASYTSVSKPKILHSIYLGLCGAGGLIGLSNVGFGDGEGVGK